ncbi:hypothetical protein GGI07_004911 [Coemansia sp. Benny D115]|nr:hypothetical protein GGI07_004911 [Coemansia sp. Benny D115]
MSFPTISANTVQLAAGLPGSVGSNGSVGFVPGSMPSEIGALAVNDNMQMQAPQYHPHANTSLIPHMRPYNMMFGIPGLGDQRVLYDDRMQMPHMAHQAAAAAATAGGGNWLRIRQPIDYVAPLKKPMNSFLLYSAERRVQLRQTHPDLNTTQQSTILAREWANLPEEEKEKYRAEAKQLRDDYNARRAELSLKLQQQLNQQHLNLKAAVNQNPGFDSISGSSMFGEDPDKRDYNRWQNLDVHGSGSFQESGSVSYTHHQMQSQGQNQNQLKQQYGQIRPSSTTSQHMQTNESHQRHHYQQQHNLFQHNNHEADLISNNLLNNTNNFFRGTFDNMASANELGSSSSGTLRAQKSASFTNFADFGSLSNIDSSLGVSTFGSGSLSAGTSTVANRLDAILSQPEGMSVVTQFSDAKMPTTTTTSSTPVAPAGLLATSGNSQNELTSKARARLSSPGRRARKKSKKDPDAPKHPMSAFLYYLTSERPRLAEHLSDMSIGQQTKIIAKQWKTMDENDRAPWEKLAKHDKDRYARERREYHGENRQAGTPATTN